MGTRLALPASCVTTTVAIHNVSPTMKTQPGKWVCSPLVRVIAQVAPGRVPTHASSGFELSDGLVGHLGVGEDVVAGRLHGSDRREVAASPLHRVHRNVEQPSDDRAEEKAVDRE